ncbi:hypothetical protein [Paenibacillus sp. DCT19]|uniref:hypothetical protein n=1 Tax=Paenibacillus sp. DCT19 TaxID=2211212 RepID=UPI000FE1D624|nr:hypothetical protein [Paenibacillus sp. DCT19]
MKEFIEKYALYSYERLQLQQPQLVVKWLYKQQSWYYILCDNLNTVPMKSAYTDITKTFDREIRVMGCPVKLVTELPNLAQKINERSQKDIINLVGNPLTINDFNIQLSLNLPKKLSSVWVDYDHKTEMWKVMSVEVLSANECEVVKYHISKLCGYEIEVYFTQREHLKNEQQLANTSFEGITLAVSKHSTLNYSKELLSKWEEDEEKWLQNREELFWSDSNELIKQNYNQSACLVNGSLGEANDIRNYLTLFKEINIIIPQEWIHEKFFSDLGVNEVDLLRLIEMNRIKLILPHSINYYKMNFLEKVIAVNPKSLMLSRELACNTLRNQRIRNPFTFLPFNTEEKRKFLSSLLELGNSLNIYENGTEYKWVESLALGLSNSWSQMYELLAMNGALGTYVTGLGPFIHNTIKSLTGNDYELEIIEAANSIEWAAANNAVLCPVGPLARNEENLAYLYSGVNRNWNFEIATSPNLITDGILTISKHVPVLEIAEAFEGNEIEKLRKLIMKLSHNQTKDQITETIARFNASVKHFEKNKKRLDVWDVRGVTLDSIIELTNSTVPFAGFITKQLGRIAEYIGSKNEGVETVLRRIEAKMSRTSPDVILVSRARDKIKDML